MRIVIQRLSGKTPCFFLSLGLSGDNRTIRRLSEDYSKTKIIRRLLYADPKSEDSRKQRLLEDYWTPFRRLLRDYWKLIRGQLKTKTIRRQFEADPKTYPQKKMNPRIIILDPSWGSTKLISFFIRALLPSQSSPNSLKDYLKPIQRLTRRKK